MLDGVYLIDRTRRRQCLYNVLVTWPGVTSTKVKRFIKRKALETTRDGTTLWDHLVSYGDYSSEEQNTALQRQISAMQNAAFDPDNYESPLAANCTLEDVVKFTSAYLDTVNLANPEILKPDGTVVPGGHKPYMRTVLKILQRDPRMQFAMVWMEKDYLRNGFPDEGDEEVV